MSPSQWIGPGRSDWQVAVEPDTLALLPLPFVRESKAWTLRSPPWRNGDRVASMAFLGRLTGAANG